MIETRRSLFKKLAAGSLAVVATRHHALALPLGKDPAAPAHFHVATHGKDTNPGTDAAPFATMARARNAVRQRISSGMGEDILVLIHGGTYYQSETLAFSPHDSGTQRRSITYAAASGEKVVLSGGMRISGWKKGSGSIWTAEVPEVKSGQLYFRQLFINGNRAARPRTPMADDKTPWWTIKTSSATDKSLPAVDVPVSLTVSSPVGAWKNPEDVEIVYIYNNEGGRKRLAAIDASSQQISLATPNKWNSIRFLDDAMLSVPSAGKACYFENALELLDGPGQWYLDRNTGLLSYWPRDGEDLTHDEVIAPVLKNTLLAVVGTPAHPVVNVHFRGIHAQYVDWPLPAWGYMGLFCCNVQSGTDEQPGHRPIEAVVEFEHARSCHFTDGAIAHAGGNAICLRNGTAYNRIEGNEISDIAGGGINAGYPNSAGGYLYAAPPPGPDEYKGYRIANNYVHHVGSEYYGGVGILLYPCQDTVVSHNLNHDCAYLGIGVAGSQDPKVPFAKNNIVEYNHIHDTMKSTVDGAGMYITFAQLDRGCLVRGNLIHETQANPYARLDYKKWPSAALYLDGNSSGGHYEENIFYRNPWAGPLIFDYRGAPRSNSWRDNLFQQSGAPPAEFLEVAQASAGLEPDYHRALRNTDPDICERTYLIDPLDKGVIAGGLAASQFHLARKDRGVIQIIRRMTGESYSATLKLAGLRAASNYRFKAWSAPIALAQTWGPPEDPMPMFSDVAPRRETDLGFTLYPGTPTFTGRQMMEIGISVDTIPHPQVLWIAYQLA